MTKEKIMFGSDKITIELPMEDMILFEREILEFEKQHNVKISPSQFVIKLLRDYVVRRNRHRFKKVPKYTFKE